MGCERTGVGEVEGERSVCCVCVEDGWGLQVHRSRTGRGQEREAFQNAYPQTPAPLSNLHFLPRPPTDTLHLLEEKFKCCTAVASSDIQAFEYQRDQKFVRLLFSVPSRTNWIFDQNK